MCVGGFGSKCEALVKGSAIYEVVRAGRDVNVSQYRVVHASARYDESMDWHHRGLPSAAVEIARRLDIHSSTAREWIRIGYALRELREIDAAFAANELSFAKVKILTRSADLDNELALLELARARPAGRLTSAIARFLAAGEDDDARDERLHNYRSVTIHTDADGMCVIRAVLPPEIGKQIAASIDEIVTKVASEPAIAGEGSAEPAAQVRSEQGVADPSANASDRRCVTVAADSTTESDEIRPRADQSLRARLHELTRRWWPSGTQQIPTMAEQRADALVLLFLGLPVDITTEVVLHVRGDGNTFNDGTPITTNAIARQLDDSFIRLLIHDAEGRPIDATNRRRHPTKRQARLVMEQHDHECVDCGSTMLLELDHNPPYEQTRHTVTSELEPRCAPCHRARHRAERVRVERLAA